MIYIYISFFRENILAATLKKLHRLLALQTSCSTILIINTTCDKETTINLPKLGKNNITNNILHFDFIYSNQNIDFFIVETGGIRLYKIDEEKVHHKEIKYISMNINFCWFEVKNK